MNDGPAARQGEAWGEVGAGLSLGRRWEGPEQGWGGGEGEAGRCLCLRRRAWPESRREWAWSCLAPSHPFAMKQLCLCASASFAVGVWVPLRLPFFPGRCSAGGGAAAGRGPDVEGAAEGLCARAGSAERCGMQVLEDTADNDLGTWAYLWLQLYRPGLNATGDDGTLAEQL